MPKNPDKAPSSRQRPVSCRFCRTRKLRCSRDSPCSNCVSRGIDCDLVNVTKPVSKTESPASDSEVLGRLRRLEVLLSQKSNKDKDTGRNSLDLHLYDAENRPLKRCGAVPAQLAGLAHDVAWLENLYIMQGVESKIAYTKIIFKICPIKEVTTAQPYIFQPDFLNSASSEPARCIWLPQYEEAQILLAKYTRDVAKTHHTLNLLSLPSLMKEAYSTLSEQGQIKPGYAILFVSIFASATHSWVPTDLSSGFLDLNEANDLAALWTKAAIDVIDVAYRSGVVSIEGIQGIIALGFVIGNFEGFSLRCRSIYNIALYMARNLGLHRVDHPDNKDIANTMQAELGRRVWWYLVSTDWTIATRFSAGGEGIYSCHPRQMITKRPLHINDEDLYDGMPRDERPMSEPTDMSYMAQRIKIGELCRTMVDRTPLSMAVYGGPTNSDIMDMDAEIQQNINNVPAFFSMTEAQLIETYRLTPEKANSIFHQGHTVFFFLNAQRLKLHIPFFTRGLSDSTFAASRELCVKCARKIIQSELQLERSKVRAATRFYFTTLLLGVFMSSIVLLMELIRTPSSENPNFEAQREETAEAFRLLEASRDESETVNKFVMTLMNILRKHKVNPPEPSAKTSPSRQSSISIAPMHLGTMDTGPQSFAQSTSLSMYNVGTTPSSSATIANGNVDMSNDSNENLATYFNEFAQNIEQGAADIGNVDWNELFSDINVTSLF